MTDTGAEVEKSPSRQMMAVEGRQQEDMNELRGQPELLADVVLSPPRGGRSPCTCCCETCSCLDVRDTQRRLHSTRLQHQFLLRKADDYLDCLANEYEEPDKEALAAAVTSFLFNCQPYFNYLESTVCRFMSQQTPLPFDLRTRLLDLSQQLCEKLEQLVLTYTRQTFFCLDETQPSSLSHFCIGQWQLGQLRLTAFRYCAPTPYLARVDTGLYKRMRWNVVRLQDRQQRADEEEFGELEEIADTVGEPTYYFLCREDMPNAKPEADDDIQDISHGNMERMWSIGQWVQVNPDPDTEDIEDWIMCEVPQADYHRLLYLGSDEPSSSRATELLQQLLLSEDSKI